MSEIQITTHPSRRAAYLLTTEQWFPVAREDLFGFFGDALNLEAITPPWLRFHVLTPSPIEMRVGQLIDYKLRLHLIPIHWKTEITVWEPPFRFVDSQLHGPYRFWIHEHTFEKHGGGTLVRDRVEYGVPGGALIQSLIVQRDLTGIFEFRRDVLRQKFGA